MSERYLVPIRKLLNAHKDVCFAEYKCGCRKPQHIQLAQSGLDITCPMGREMHQGKSMTSEEYFGFHK